MNLEDELRSALRRRDPPPDFTARVLKSVAPRSARRPVRPWVGWLGALAASLLLAAGDLGYRHYQGERAKAEVLQAIHIAASKLNVAQKKVQMISHRSNS